PDAPLSREAGSLRPTLSLRNEQRTRQGSAPSYGGDFFELGMTGEVVGDAEPQAAAAQFLLAPPLLQLGQRHVEEIADPVAAIHRAAAAQHRVSLASRPAAIFQQFEAFWRNAGGDGERLIERPRR